MRIRQCWPNGSKGTFMLLNHSLKTEGFNPSVRFELACSACVGFPRPLRLPPYDMHIRWSVSVLALWQTGDMARVYSTSHLKSARTASAFLVLSDWSKWTLCWFIGVTAHSGLHWVTQMSASELIIIRISCVFYEALNPWNISSSNWNINVNIKAPFHLFLMGCDGFFFTLWKKKHSFLILIFINNILILILLVSRINHTCTDFYELKVAI